MSGWDFVNNPKSSISDLIEKGEARVPLVQEQGHPNAHAFVFQFGEIIKENMISTNELVVKISNKIFQSLGWKNFLGSTQEVLKQTLPIIIDTLKQHKV